MKVLLDTGILLRLVNRGDKFHRSVVSAVLILRRRGDALVTTSQNIAEFWNVSTRPAQARGGLGRTIQQTERCVQFFERLGTVLRDAPSAYDIWRGLVITHQISGKAVHDARLVALMTVSAVNHIVTLNPDDFRRYPGITILTPDELNAGEATF